MRVTFMGWSSRWDEDKKITPSTVKPFRDGKMGYNGAEKSKITDEREIDSLMIELFEIEQIMGDFRNYIANTSA